jgi:hypothetical protein
VALISGNCFRLVFAEIQPANNTSPFALQIYPFGRLGNNFIQLIHGLAIAHFLNVSYIFVPPGFFYINDTIVTITGVRLIPGKSPFANTHIGGYFFNSNKCVASIERWVVGMIRPIFWKLWDNYSVPPDAVYMHIRSGDLFDRPTPQRNYGQPPCPYYTEAALMHGNMSRAVLVTDGGGNPCIPFLADLGVEIPTLGVGETIGRLIRARRFVMSRSTFSLMAFALSHLTETGNFYTFAYSTRLVAHHWDCKPSEFYEKTVRLNWRNSPQQKEIMLQARCESWKYYE